MQYGRVDLAIVQYTRLIVSFMHIVKFANIGEYALAAV